MIRANMASAENLELLDFWDLSGNVTTHNVTPTKRYSKYIIVASGTNTGTVTFTNLSVNSGDITPTLVGTGTFTGTMSGYVAEFKYDSIAQITITQNASNPTGTVALIGIS